VPQLHLAVASTTSLPGELTRNLEQIIGFARRAGADGVDLLLTPEMSATGYGGFPEVIALAEVAGDGPVYETLAREASETGVTVCAGFVEKGIGCNYLSHYAIFPDSTFIVQRKHRVTHSEQPLAPAFAQLAPLGGDGTGTPAQTDFQIFKVKDVACAIVICADTGIENIRADLAARGVQVMLAPTGAGGKREDRVTNQELKTAEGREKYSEWLEKVFFPGRQSIEECIELGQALAAVNLCGYDRRRHYHLGHGMIINALGEVPAFFHGQPNMDRQRPMYAHALIDTEEKIGNR
jgi:predicted amidohydrolase